MPLRGEVVVSLVVVEEALEGVVKVVAALEVLGHRASSSSSSSTSLLSSEEMDSSSQESRTSESLFLPLFLEPVVELSPDLLAIVKDVNELSWFVESPRD